MPELHESHTEPHEPAPPPATGDTLGERLRRYLKEWYDQGVDTVRNYVGARPHGAQADTGHQGGHQTAPVNTDSLGGTLAGSRAAHEAARQIRPPEIPRSVAAQKAWKRSPEGQAWKARIDEQMPPEIKSALDSPESESRRRHTDEMQERLREEMLERQAHGNPMSVAEYEDRFTEGMREVGQHARDDERERKRADERSEPVYDMSSFSPNTVALEI